MCVFVHVFGLVWVCDGCVTGGLSALVVIPEVKQSLGGPKWLQGSIWGQGKGSGPSNAACLSFSFALPLCFHSLPTWSSTYWLISEGFTLSRSKKTHGKGFSTLSILPLGSFLSPPHPPFQALSV